MTDRGRLTAVDQLEECWSPGHLETQKGSGGPQVIYVVHSPPVPPGPGGLLSSVDSTVLCDGMFPEGLLQLKVTCFSESTVPKYMTVSPGTSHARLTLPPTIH